MILIKDAVFNPTGGGYVPPINTNIMITIKKATKKQAEENARKMSDFQLKMRQKKSEQQG